MKRLFPIILISAILSSIAFIATPKKTYLALGDGYTVGESLKPSLSWPNQLKRLISQNDQLELETQIKAKAGWKIENLMKSILATENKKFDYISLQIGVNDYNSSSDPEKFKLKYKKLIESSLKLSKNGTKGMFVLAIPDYSFSPKGQSNYKKIHKDLTTLNEVIRVLCLEYEILFIDINEEYSKTKIKKEYLATNQIHPSESMYKLWVELIYASLNEKKLIN